MPEYRVLLFGSLALLSATLAWSEALQEYRVAAIISAGEQSKALIEAADGNQEWFETGDSVGSSPIVLIDADGVTLLVAGSEARLLLRGTPVELVEPHNFEEAPAREQSRSFSYISVISQMESVSREEGESQEQAVARNLNQALGLAQNARITSVERVAVATATEARNELRQRLLGSDPIRIAIAGGELTVLYVVSDP